MQQTTKKPTRNIVKGSDVEITVRIAMKGDCDNAGDPFDLTGVTEITAYFKKDDETFLEKKLTTNGILILSPAAGKMKIILNDTDTSSLYVGDEQSFEVEIEIGTTTTIVQFIESLNVIDRVISSN